MKCDIVISAYKSNIGLAECLAALLKAKGSTDTIGVSVVYRKEQLALIQALETDIAAFARFEVIELGRSTAKALAADALRGDMPYILFIDANTRVSSGLFSQLDIAVQKHRDAGAFTCRVLPCESEAHIRPDTLEAYTIDSCFLLSRQALAEAGGFDVRVGDGCAKELAIRIRSIGRQIFYLPRALVYQEENELSQQGLQRYCKQLLAQCFISSKYGKYAPHPKAHSEYISAVLHPVHFDGVRKLLTASYIAALPQFIALWCWRFTHAHIRAAASQLKHVPVLMRGRGELERPVQNAALISVIMRTHARCDVLRASLCSVRNQTYDKYEVIIVEDGEDSSSAMLNAEFADMNITYIATLDKVGRARAGNIGLEAAKGEYCCFLDDDDFFYPEHLEYMAAKALEYPQAELILSASVAAKAQAPSAVDRACSIDDMQVMRFARIDSFTMCQSGQIPIQSACFKKSLYLKCGGLDETLVYGEDWAMWLKFIACAQRTGKQGADISRATSMYMLPLGQTAEHERASAFAQDEHKLYNNDNIRFDVSMADMRRYYYGLLCDMEHLDNLGQVKEYITDAKKRYE